MTESETLRIRKTKATVGNRIARVDEIMYGLFDAIWDKLAMQSKCDGRGGAEYDRVRSEFTVDVPWTHLETWIHERANQPARAETPSSSAEGEQPE